MRKLVYWGLSALLFASIASGSAYADSAASDWNSSAGYTSANDNANAFNAAEALYLLQHGQGGTNVNYYGDVTSNSSSTTNCMVTQACPTGGSNLSGVTVNTVTSSSGITIDSSAASTATQSNKTLTIDHH